VIPQTNPQANYLAHRDSIDAAIRRVLEAGWFILGQEVRTFEQEFAAYVGCRFAAGVANGTDALELALRASGIGPGDVVLTVSHTAVATVAAIERAGASAVLVDIDPDTYTMDPKSLAQAIGHMGLRSSPWAGRLKAIVPVHLYGHAAELDAILSLAGEHDLVVVEDCAQSHGATFNGRRLGTFGLAASFSFYPTKNLGALGDGGMVVTSDEGVAERLRMLREYGWRQRYVSDVPGVNSRLDELQAAVLRAKLPHLDADNARRQAIAAEYQRALGNGKVTAPVTRPGCTHVFHQYVIRTPSRDALREELKARGVGTLIHYPMPVHLQPAYRDRLPPVVPLQASERAALEVLSLPMFAELQPNDVDAVIAHLNACPSSGGMAARS
jgi:dTDP-4-amino-4,6-dideoxygalactose transaminase